MAYAKTTEVPVERSRAEIERMCTRYGCAQFMSGVDYENHSARVQFKSRDRIVRFELTLPRASDFKDDRKFQQAMRSKWRALVLVIKGKLESVESGIATFEEEFLPYIVMPNDMTVAAMLVPMIDSAYSTGLMPKQLLLGDGN